ncbi:E3 ubiquitin-protein ligase TRIM21-like [Aquarana catesbeiana]|uniref:E3 ubiquitin-protein ligase TRIM21-like n=1 Tax=Aquarana catesbeiana TaxID=8400 RepID=UPI003CCA1E7D
MKPELATLRCGHNFCQECVTNVLSAPEEFGVSDCAECQEWLQEQQKKEELPNPDSFQTELNPDSSQSEVEGSKSLCTFCIGSSVPAVKYCLRCEAFLCGPHLLVHKVSPDHVLCDASTSPHNYSALTHKGSDEVMIDLLLEKLTTKKEKTQKRVLSLRGHQEKVREKAAGVTDGVNVLFKGLQKQLKKIQKRVLQETSRQENKVSQSLSDLIQKLEMETEELSRKVHHIEELWALRDPSHVLQDEGFRDINKAAYADEDLEDEAGDVNEESLSEMIHDGLFQMINAVSPEIRTQSLTRVHLDMDTAADNVCISEDLQAASWSVLRQKRPATPQRFESFQVLSSTVFPLGRYYWRVKTSASGSWRVGVCYPSMDRRGDTSVIGNNDKSWCVCQICDSKNLFSHAAKHDKENTALPFSLSCNRLGIYLDYEAGRLSFYELRLPIRHLHTFTTTFTEPLHAAIYVCGEEQKCPTWVRFMD